VGSIGMRGCGKHGGKVNWTEVERGGRIELLTVAMASGERRRTEGVLLLFERRKEGSRSASR
jgi:hypothetical protein